MSLLDRWSQVKQTCVPVNAPPHVAQQPRSVTDDQIEVNCIDTAIEQLRQRLRPHGVAPLDVERDGHCFFHVLAHELPRIVGQGGLFRLFKSNNIDHASVRAFLCDWAEENAEVVLDDEGEGTVMQLVVVAAAAWPSPVRSFDGLSEQARQLNQFAEVIHRMRQGEWADECWVRSITPAALGFLTEIKSSAGAAYDLEPRLPPRGLPSHLLCQKRDVLSLGHAVVRGEGQHYFILQQHLACSAASLSVADSDTASCSDSDTDSRPASNPDSAAILSRSDSDSSNTGSLRDSKGQHTCTSTASFEIANSGTASRSDSKTATAIRFDSASLAISDATSLAVSNASASLVGGGGDGSGRTSLWSMIQDQPKTFVHKHYPGLRYVLATKAEGKGAIEKELSKALKAMVNGNIQKYPGWHRTASPQDVHKQALDGKEVTVTPGSERRSMKQIFPTPPTVASAPTVVSTSNVVSASNIVSTSNVVSATLPSTASPVGNATAGSTVFVGPGSNSVDALGTTEQIAGDDADQVRSSNIPTSHDEPCARTALCSDRSVL